MVLSTTIRVITVVKMLSASWVSNKFWPLWWRVSLSIKLYTTLNHIRFVFYYNIKETKSLSWQLTPTRIWKCTPCIMQMTAWTRQTQKLLQTRLMCSNNWKKILGKTVMSVLVIDKSTYHEKPHFDLFFYHNINVKENVFLQSARWKRYCVTRWRQQRGMDSYLLRQISQSDCEITCNCGKKQFSSHADYLFMI